MTTEVDLSFLNETELCQRIRSQTGVIVARAIGRDRMVELLHNNWVPEDTEVSKTNDSRKRLQLYVAKNWVGIQSQLPCKGENKGHCTIYPCSEGRHVDCLLAAGPHLKIHGL